MLFFATRFTARTVTRDSAALAALVSAAWLPLAASRGSGVRRRGTDDV